MQNYNYMLPIWDGDTVYNEAILPLADPRLQSEVIPLLYRAEEIISVSDSTLTTRFTSGIDYILRDGGIVIPEGSRIKKMSWDEYNPKDKSPNAFTDIGFTCSEGGYLRFAEGAEYHTADYFVTYRHRGVWQGPTIAPNLYKLKKFRSKLSRGDGVCVAITGDSIATGCNSSGMAPINVPPYLPIWSTMVCEQLAAKYRCDVRELNRAKGGMVSQWGVDTAHESFDGTSPDLCIIAYGMNDASGEIPSETLCANYDKIAQIMLQINPSCEFLFVSTTLPNPLANQFYKKHEEQEPLLRELAERWGARADVVPMTSIHKYLLTKKRYYDMTGNNINHPNDFLARVYAQAICGVI